jgi:phage recombination protein Bet
MTVHQHDTATKERVQTPPLAGEVFDAPSQTHQLTRPGAPAPGEQHEESPLAQEYTPAQIALLKRTIAKGATDDELMLFLQVARRLRLDPFAKQIHAVKRWDSKEKREAITFQVAIDGFRLIAERTGKYGGQLPLQWARVTFDTQGEPIIKWYDVWPFEENPHAARARVLRTDFKEPMEAIARFSAYAQVTKDGELVKMWEKMDAEQLGKCAEALALRKAFPQELAGVYTVDEMGQADNPADAPRPAPGEKKQEARRGDEKVETLAQAIEFKLPWRKHAKYGTPIVELSNKNLERALEWCDKVRKEAEAEGNKPGAVVTNLERAANLILAARETGELETPADDVEDPAQAKLFDTSGDPDPTGTPAGSSPPSPAASAPSSDASSTSTPSSTGESPTTTPSGSPPKPTKATSAPSGSTPPPSAPSTEAAGSGTKHPYRPNTVPEGRLALDTLENTDPDEASKYDLDRAIRDAIDKGPFTNTERPVLKQLFASANTDEKRRKVRQTVLDRSRELPF